MSAAKRTSKSSAGPVGDLAGWAFGRGRGVAAGLLALATFFLAWWWVWHRVGPSVTGAERMWVTLDDLHVTPQPEWTRAEIRSEVYQWLRLGGPINLLDVDLGPRVAEGFGRHPCVDRVLRVTRLPARGVEVELEYRRPACVVKIGEQLLLVDHRSILLPAEGIPRAELERYPQLAGIDSPPVAVYGEPWGDIRVAGGAAIANELAEVWESWHLARIVPFPFVAPDGREQVHYSVFSRDGTRIVWGLPPGAEGPAEPSAEEKLASLKAYRIQHGTFDGPTGPLDLDVRVMPRS